MRFSLSRSGFFLDPRDTVYSHADDKKIAHPKIFLLYFTPHLFNLLLFSPQAPPPKQLIYSIWLTTKLPQRSKFRSRRILQKKLIFLFIKKTFFERSTSNTVKVTKCWKNQLLRDDCTMTRIVRRLVDKNRLSVLRKSAKWNGFSKKKDFKLEDWRELS